MTSKLKRQPIYIILGSGGHTTEMSKIILVLLEHSKIFGDQQSLCKLIVAKSDVNSKQWFKRIMESSGYKIMPDAFVNVPRSREVGQNWLSTLFTTIYALIWCLCLVIKDRPRLILCNGPGTCVPFCLAIYICRLLRILNKFTKIIYIESICRVENLSLSGKLLISLVDLFVVQWQPLADKYVSKYNVKYFRII